MSRYRLTVVLSQAAGKHPAKRSLEEDIVAALLMELNREAGVTLVVVTHSAELAARCQRRIELQNGRLVPVG